MTEFAAVRPDEWNPALLVHVLGAFALIGTLALAASFLFAARRDGSLELTRLGYRSLLLGALPAYIATRVGAQWIASKEGLDDADLTWITFGYISTDAGLLLLLGATITTGLAVRRAGAVGAGVSVAAWLVALLIAVYVVAVYLMATKPA